jgi:uncharacterized protein (DUF1697 family)
MTTWVALLRGINLGSHNKVAMGELRHLAEEIGLSHPQTHVRSGNLIVESDRTENEVVHLLEEALGERFGLEIPVICRSGEELTRIASSHPFSGLGLDERMLHVAFLDGEPEADVTALIDSSRYEPDRFEAHGREVYLAYPNGSGRSKLNHALLERRLGVSATGRNWRTVSTLAGMVEERP